MAVAVGCGSDRGGGTASNGPFDADAGDGRAPEGGDECCGESLFRDVTVDQTLDDAPATETGADGALLGDAAFDADAQANVSADSAGDAPGDSSTGLVQAGGNLAVYGYTTDGYVIYYDGTTRTYYAKSDSDASAPQALYTASPTLTGAIASVTGRFVFIWGYSPNLISGLSMWSSGMLLPISLSNTALLSFYKDAWASDDSKYIAYVQLTGASTSVGAIYGANADGTHPTLLLSGIVTSSGSCFPHLVFTGGYAVISYCVQTDAGTVPMLQTFQAGGGWPSALVVPNITLTNAASPLPYLFDPFLIDPDGGLVATAAAADSGVALETFGLDGGGATVVDPNTGLTASQFLAGSATNPWSLFFNTPEGGLVQSYASAAAPQVVETQGVDSINSTSLDGQWILATTKASLELSLVSTLEGGAVEDVAAPIQYDSLPVGAFTLPNAGFTRDGSHAVFLTDIGSSGNYSTFYVRSMSIAAPNDVQLLSNGFAVFLVQLRGSKVLLFDNLQLSDAGGPATVDLRVIDTASNAPATVIATSVPLVLPLISLRPGGIMVSPDLTKVAYPVNSGPSPGIYVSELP
jgi:hypothetical protein